MKKVVIFGWYKFVNAYVEGDKKNFGFSDFCWWVAAFLIENLTLIAQQTRRGVKMGIRKRSKIFKNIRKYSKNEWKRSKIFDE